MNIQVSGPSAFDPNNIPPRRGGGGGRRSELLDQLRNTLNQPNTMCTIDVQPEENENMHQAINRTTARIYRKGALPFDFFVRTNPELGQINIYRTS